MCSDMLKSRLGRWRGEMKKETFASHLRLITIIILWLCVFIVVFFVTQSLISGVRVKIVKPTTRGFSFSNSGKLNLGRE